jgi:hypothetical protein
MAHIPEAQRKQVYERAKGYCEYCRAAQMIIVEMEIDHIVPESVGGKTEIDHLCLSCGPCNRHKQSSQTGIDPETDDEVLLYNPRLQNWDEHFVWSEDGVYLIGLTPTGRATIVRLRINAERRITARRHWVMAGWHPPKL